ncbi:MAG: alpha/beta hydrolase [Paracoccaceae bacterium]
MITRLIASLRRIATRLRVRLAATPGQTSIAYRSGRRILQFKGHLASGPDFVLLHGGGWFAGKPTDNLHWLEVLRPHARTVNLVEYGVKALHGVGIDAGFDDARTASLHIARQARHGVVLMGFSAGAAMAVETALHLKPGQLRGLLLFSPATDLSATGFRNNVTGDAGRLDLSPVDLLASHVGRLLCPCVIFHGTNDKVIPLAASLRFQQGWMQTQKGSMRVIEVPRCGHGLDKVPHGFAIARAELEAGFLAGL